MNKKTKKQQKSKAIAAVKKNVQKLSFFMEYQTLDVEYNFA